MKLLDRWRHSEPERRAKTIVVVALSFCLLAYTYVHFSNAWIGEDPYITYRTVDNFVEGFGLTWNTDERVQAYTHPLWMFVLSGGYAITHEAFYTTIFICFACALATLVLVCRSAPGGWYRPLVVTAFFVGSKAFVDYSSSGLENPLTDLLLAVFFIAFLRERRDLAAGDVLFLTGVGAFCFLNRQDTALIVGPALAWVYVTHARRLGAATMLRIIVLGTAPAWGWLLFSTVYYGFPFPNTAYSKLSGGQGRALHPNALAYFVNSLRWDPLTLPTVAAAFATVAVRALRRERGAPRALLAVLGTGMYLAYVVRIGGDYMSGRFFAAPFLVALLLLLRSVQGARAHLALAGAVLLAIVVGPRPPVLSAIHYEQLRIEPTGIRDERGHYHVWSSFLTVYFRDHETPGKALASPGTKSRIAEPKVLIWGAIGYEGFISGPNVQTIDPIGLPDPLLARLPSPDVELGWGRGHLFRALPEGYVASLELGENVIADPALYAYYEHLRRITRGAIFTKARFREIWRMNTGAYQPLLDAYVKHGAAPASLLEPVIVHGEPGLTDALDGLPSEERDVLAPLVAMGLRVLTDVRDFALPTDVDYSEGESFPLTTRRDRLPAPAGNPTLPHVKRRGAPADAAVRTGNHVVALRWRHGSWAEVRALGALRQLRVLDLYDGALRSLAGIEVLENLEYLDVSRNPLASIAPVAGLRQLRVLYAAQSSLARIEGVTALRELRELNLALNHIERIEALDGPVGRALSYLSLEGNPIGRIEGLAALGELRTLNLSYCRITALENLGGLPNLAYVNLFHNGVRLANGLEQVPSVEYIALGENPFDWGRDNLGLWERLGEGKLFYLR